jgi:hypothetical protein
MSEQEEEKKDPEVSTSVEVVEFTEKFKKEFSLMTCLSGNIV